MRRFTRKACLKLFTIVFFIHLLVIWADTARAQETLGGIDNMSAWCYGWGGVQVNQIQFALKVLGDDYDVTKLTLANASKSDIGQTFTVTNGSPQFSAFTSYLTNGTDDKLVLFAIGPDGTGGGYVFSEASMLNFFGNGPDFAGSEIQSISLTLNNLVLQYPVSIPGSPELGGNFNYVQYDVTLFFDGSPIPEPATLLLLGLGAAMLRKRR